MQFVAIQKIQEEHAIALQDIVSAIFDRVNALQIPVPMRVYLTKQMADLEYRLTLGTNEALQMNSLIGIFLTARSLVTA